MLDFEQSIKFEESLKKEASLAPYYQVTKISDDSYVIFSNEDKSSDSFDGKGALKAIASMRGGTYLDSKLAKAITDLNHFESIIITEDALKVGKTASAEHTNREPWKLVAVNGVEYFVKADAEVEEEQKKEAASEASLSKTASAKEETYTVRIKAHNMNEIGKIAGFAEEAFGALPGSFEVSNTEPNVIVFDAPSKEDIHGFHKQVVDGLGNKNVILPDSGIQVLNPAGDCCQGQGQCTCPACKHHEHHEEHHEHHPQAPQGQFMLTTPEGPKTSIASSVDTLKVYADAHYSNYSIIDDKGQVMHSVASDNTSFANELEAFLLSTASAKESMAKIATVIGQDGKTKQEGDVEVGDTVVDDEGKAKKITETAAALPNMEAQAAPEAPANIPPVPAQQPAKEVAPTEKPADETNASGDDDVKRWKGMREDPSSGKFIVYITETTEHIFDNPNDAIDFLVKK